MGPIITLRGVGKRYPGSTRPALDAIDLDVEAGRITAIMGPSGCGKSTLLNLIGALDRPSSGEIVMDGVRVDRLSETAAARFRRAKVGFVFQFFHLLEDLTVRENVAVPAILAGRPRAEADARADEMLAQLGLADHRKKFPATLSGGERQRLAIARMLLKAPAVVILDEATAHLDSGSEAAVQAALDEALTGRTSIVIAHRLSTVRQADSIVVLDHGRVVDQGTHAELLARGGVYAELYRTQFAEGAGSATVAA